MKRLNTAEQELLRKLFHAPFYRLAYPDAGASDKAAFEHFTARGLWENLRPHPLFDPAFYFIANPDVSESATPAFLHYVRYGGREGRVFSRLLEIEAYNGAYRSEVAATQSGSILEDFITSPDRSAAFAFFDAEFYLNNAQSNPQADFNRALEDFLVNGLQHAASPHILIEVARFIDRERIIDKLNQFELLFSAENALSLVSTHPLVDPEFYVDRYGPPPVHPVIDFLRNGRSDTKLSLHPLFDASFYGKTYGPKDSVSALLAYIKGGLDATSPNAFFDPAYYRETYGKDIAEGMSALDHYMAHGHLPWFDPSPLFAQRFYLTRYPDVEQQQCVALEHFLTVGKANGYVPKPAAPCLDPTAGRTREAVVGAIRDGATQLPGVPQVSVIIPVYGELDVTLCCLLSILQARDSTPFEIIVVDDASPDGSGQELAASLEGLPGIRVIVSAENQGFLKTCNAGAAMAATRFLYFLNNDTIVLDGWLDELIATFGDQPEAGLVGAKLVYPDGRLQEAGGVVWEDASAANYGRLGDPQAPAYNYMRDVDYVSGAAIMIRAEAWQAVDGFSETYAPAYYEDTDIAMKLRAAGWRVLYQPHAVVVHREGVSSGTDVTSGVKRYQLVNKERFLDTWRETLAAYGRSGDLSRAVVDRKAKARILFLDAEVPTPDRDSGSITTFHYLRILARLGHRVTFVAQNAQRFGRYSGALERFGVEVLASPYLAGTGSEYVLTHGGDYDMIVLARAPLGGKLITQVKSQFPTVPVVFDTVDLHHLRMMREYEQTADPQLFEDAVEMKSIELSAINAADATLLVSDAEADAVRDEIGPFPHVVVPLIYPPYTPRAGYQERRDVAFVGNFRHPPNADAVRFLAQNIWPAVRDLGGMADAKLYIVGAWMTDEIRDFADSDIQPVGYVEDLEGFLERIRITVAPLRFGAGVKGKIGSSLRLGVPVVTTSLGAEGMQLQNGVDVLIADDASAFAAQLTRLYGDQQLWEALAVAGRRAAEERFSIAAATKQLEALCGALLPPNRAGL